ncbi:T9SS type A sorting domain-containing protein [Psychroserpens algicola]|uniref:T9SS type A sorting domain-containing protein n=1 Tax=Psychroserpens algicola TaxID=1719034 RepID=A0ABT0H9N4_9FLAO|nr:T9SS type A sorting domain-containing protein [Psychroserpens algicola]MCK8480535.1 T9SS type A sorting domain-containing protein [Psychroserpens algicola]
MKHCYLTTLTLLVFAFGFSQSTIVTVDRPNIIGPTATGNSPEIASTGLVRGSGVSLASTGANFTSNQWNGTSQAEAVTNNDYIEWSVSASADNSIEITEFDIRNRRNANGPTNWQVFYSLDNFTTPGIAAIPVQTSTATASNFNFNGLSIISGTAGTVTFRLYAWNSVTNNGWFRIAARNAWSDFGIASPGLRIIGTITTTTLNSTESNIIATAFDPTDNIDYTSYNATSGLTTSNAIKIGEFTIQDGGNDLTDTDVVATLLTGLSLDITNSENIAALALFDGSTNISEVTSISSTVDFSGIIGLSAPDESSKTFDVYATFNSAVTDNDQIQLTISSALADAVLGSTFNDFDGGGAQTPIAGDDNRIEVTATAFEFDQQPTDTYQFEIMTPFPIVIAVDGNGNQDLDYNGTISVVAAGSLEPSLINYTMTNGSATFDSIVFTEKETVTTLLAFGGGLSPAVSDPFDVNGPLICIAVQDFDASTPEWNYSSNVATFDNGWGTDGYYGLIDISSASPLDNPSFSNTIFGENDLNDEGDNGTTGFATLSFDPIDISSFENVKLSFDWDVHGYVNNSDDAQYRLVYDGVNQPVVFLLDGNGAIDTDEGTVSIDIPDAVSTIALQIRVRNNGINGYSGFDNFKLVSVFDGLLYVDNGWSPNPPSDTTGTDNAYVLDGTYNVATNIELNNLYVNTDAATSISAGQSITTNSGLVNNGTFELNSVSTSYSSLIVNGAVDGDVIYKRHVNTTSDPGESGENDLISAPVYGQTFGDFAAANSNIVENPSDVSVKLFGPFNKFTGLYQSYDLDVPADANAILDVANGYRAASTNSDTFTFEGLVANTVISKPIVVSGPNSPEWNLIGNPYPSYLKLSDFLASNNSEFDPPSAGIYGYDGDASDGWQIWNLAYSDANPNAKITPGQGFLVASKAGGATITFTPTMRTIGTTDDFIAGRSGSQTLAHLKLQMRTTDASYNTDIYFNDNASLGMDIGYDSSLFSNYTPSFSLYSHLVNDNTGLNLAVQSVNYDAINDVVIPLGVHANQGEQITISIFETNIQSDIDVYLEDTLTNTFTLLNTSDYVFTSNTSLSGTGRFFLRFSGDALSTPETNFDTIQIYTTKTPKVLHINGVLQNDTKATIFDIQGRLIMSETLNQNNSDHQIDISNIKSGVYIVRLDNGLQQKSQKVIIR